MYTSKLVAIGVATLLLISGVAVGSVAAVGAASVGDANSAADAETPANASDGVGPSDGLPDPVPDRVSEIHETIESFLNGRIDNLGSALGDLLGSADDGGTTSDGDANDDAGSDRQL